MMAEAPVASSADAFTEQELTCSICLDIFNDPVSTPCGHNFCQACIGGYWASSAVCTCPLCKRQFDERPQLSINRVFALITDQYKARLYGTPLKPAAGASATNVVAASSTNPFVAPQASDEELVMCDVCSGVKQPAVSSCLTCTASYCDVHVQPHRTTAFYANHRLLDPQEALRGRTCSLHRRLLEVYCRTCERCICAICVLQDHRTHKTVSVQTERLSKQKLVGKMELELQNRIERKNLRLIELKDRLQGVKNYADKEQGELENLLADVTRSVERIRSELVGGIQDKRATVETKGEGLVVRLEAELHQLGERRAKLEAQATSQDHIAFIQGFEEANAPLGSDSDLLDDVDEEAGLSLHFHLGDVKGALIEVRERMDDIRMGEVRSRGSRGSFSSGEVMINSESMISVRGSHANLKKSHLSLRDVKKIKPGSGLKKVRPYLEDVTLNPVTAYPFLILSDDRKQVKRGEKLQFYRNSHHRYDVWSCVIAKEGFNSGRHYWEVNVGENKDWKLGVVRGSAQRKGLFDMSPANGYYAIWWSGSQLRALTNPPLTKIKGSSKLHRVGIFLDVEEGQVSFYNAKTGSDIYTFSAPEYRETLFPLLGTGDKEVPLILITAQSAGVHE